MEGCIGGYFDLSGAASSKRKKHKARRKAKSKHHKVHDTILRGKSGGVHTVNAPTSW